MSPFLREVIAEIEHCGGRVEDLWHGRHFRIRWSIGTANFTDTIPGTPSDQRGLRNALATIRRRARQAKGSPST
jgi:hypothetical protein